MQADAGSVDAGRGIFNRLLTSDPRNFRDICEGVFEYGRWTKDKFLDSDRYAMIRDRFINDFFLQGDDWKQVDRFLKYECDIEAKREIEKAEAKGVKQDEIYGLYSSKLLHILLCASEGHIQETEQESVQRKALQEVGRKKYEEFSKALKEGKKEGVKEAATQALQNLGRDFRDQNNRLLEHSEKKDQKGMLLCALKNRWDFSNHAVVALKEEKWHWPLDDDCRRAQRDLAALEVTNFVAKFFDVEDREAVETFLFQRAFEGNRIMASRPVKVVPLTSKQIYIHCGGEDMKVLKQLKAIFQELAS